MPNVTVTCPTCGTQMEIDARRTVAYCGSCGALIEREKEAPAEPAPVSVSQPEIDESKLSKTVKGWKTSYGWSCIGIFVSLMVNGMPLDWIQTIEQYLLVVIAAFVVPFVYAIIIYPKYFKPEEESSLGNGAISFLNCAFGGPIFGCLWNCCLTRKRIGISHIVMMVLIGLFALRNIALVL